MGGERSPELREPVSELIAAKPELYEKLLRADSVADRAVVMALPDNVVLSSD